MANEYQPNCKDYHLIECPRCGEVFCKTHGVIPDEDTCGECSENKERLK